MDGVPFEFCQPESIKIDFAKALATTVWLSVKFDKEAIARYSLPFIYSSLILTPMNGGLPRVKPRVKDRMPCAVTPQAGRRPPRESLR